MINYDFIDVLKSKAPCAGSGIIKECHYLRELEELCSTLTASSGGVLSDPLVISCSSQKGKAPSVFDDAPDASVPYACPHNLAKGSGGDCVLIPGECALVNEWMKRIGNAMLNVK